MAQAPILPYGSPSLLSALSESFSFHASPENFITARVLAFRSQHPEIAETRAPVHAKVLNRNVAVISSFHHVKQLLLDEGNRSRLSSLKAYDELMAPFFPPPNLLLQDPPNHQQTKDMWRARMEDLPNQIREKVQAATVSHFRNITSGSRIDLYDSMKELSWNLILACFLTDSDGNVESAESAEEIVGLQESLLRGQFSLFPVSIHTPFWASPRAKGLAARKSLQTLLRRRMDESHTGCPFAASTPVEKDDVANHLLLFTSSLAVKALASLLTAVLLNLYVKEKAQAEVGNWADTVRSTEGRGRGDDQEEARIILLDDIVNETERLSPPVVGIMRRTTQDVILTAKEKDGRDTLIPKGWDAWLYFVGANRDPAHYGPRTDNFDPDRHHVSPFMSFAFGAGPKTCLGADLMRQVVKLVARICIGENHFNRRETSSAHISIGCEKSDLPIGVQGWLGQCSGVKPEDWARDMKQLPTQRPIKPIWVIVDHNLGT